jgi:hypothetical protein
MHSLMTDSREDTALFSGLPDEFPSLRKIVLGLLIHEDWVGSYGVSAPTKREKEIK